MTPPGNLSGPRDWRGSRQ